ncbi:MAG: ornithine aminomutase [Acholeplasmatales bacterium]|nr:MAG: ornithine aminomutase [Acholeplasmatales bacterium]
MKERHDDYEMRRQHLKDLSDEALKAYFFELTEKVVDPLLDLAHKNTSKSIERSVLLRMGFSSIEANAIVNALHEYGLLSKGAGHCVYRLSRDMKMTLREAGKQIIEGDGISTLQAVFT